MCNFLQGTHIRRVNWQLVLMSIKDVSNTGHLQRCSAKKL